MKPYDTVRQAAGAEFVEKKSRFLAAIAPVQSEEEAIAFLGGKRTEHREARHNTYAFILKTGVKRCSDDGEPQGTAGAPILDCLEREGLTDVVLVVTRYFGGILLGAGGLTRAYSHSARLAVEAAERVTMQPCRIFLIEFDYSFHGKISNLLSRHGCAVKEEEFGAKIKLTMQIATDGYPGFLADLTELTAAVVKPQILDEVYGEPPQKR